MTETISSPESGAQPASKQAVSSQTALVLESHEIRTLTEIGFLAAGNGYIEQALCIFNALRLIRPERAFPLIGLAVTRMNTGQTRHAVQLLEAARLSCPTEQAQCDAWLGFALQQSGHHHAGRQRLETVLANTGAADPQLVALAQALLNRNAATMARPNTADVSPPTHGKR